MDVDEKYVLVYVMGDEEREIVWSDYWLGFVSASILILTPIFIALWFGLL